MSTFSIIIPFYNAERYLHEALLSVQNQSFTDWECLLINDASTDNSEQIALSMVSSDERFKLDKNFQNKGVSSSRNLGLYKAKSKWICFLDADDIWKENKLEKDFEIIQHSDSQLVFIYSTTQLIHNSIDNKGNLYGAGNNGLTQNPFFSLLSGMHIHLSTVVVRNELIKKKSVVFNEKMRFAEDTLFCYELLRFGSVFFNNQVLSYYRVDVVSSTSFIPKKEQIMGSYIVFENLLLKVKTSVEKKIVSLYLVKIGFKKLIVLSLLKQRPHFSLYFSTLLKILKNKNVFLLHKVYALILPFSILINKWFK
ncbi:MAG: glycosyltransferase family 2 protein [Flavobacteriia bacterium]|nr:glycosyltransferase family 2 protein [Flavobacteriia bacterium]